MRLSKKQLEFIREFFSDKPVLKAYIFGSYARNDATEHSDIDFLIDWDYSQHIGWGYVGMWRELSQYLGKEVDIVSVRWIDPVLEEKINRDKQLVYERKTG